MAETGRYLYAVTRGLAPEATVGATGVAGTPVEMLEHRGLTVLVSTVDLAEFGEEPLQQNLEEMVWLERTARQHDDVVRIAADQGATAPLRMLTICHDDAGVRDRLDALYEELTAALDRVEGRHEWSVKVVVPPQQDRAEVGASAPAGGAAYLRAKKAAAESRRTGADEAARTAQALHEDLARHASASRRLRPQDPRLTGIPGTMTLNAAYLVDDATCDEFAAAVAGAAGRHPEVELSVDGPWPPYSFAMTDSPMMEAP